jgi:hypothetical protein
MWGLPIVLRLAGKAMRIVKSCFRRSVDNCGIIMVITLYDSGNSTVGIEVIAWLG